MHPSGRLNQGQFNAFIGRYFAVFGLGYLLCMITIGVVTAAWAGAYLRAGSTSEPYVWAAGGILCLLLCTGQFAMIRGLRWGIWVMVASQVAPLCMALSLFETHADGILRAVAVALPLLALLTFNSQRYRAMRQRLMQMRLQRAGLLPFSDSDESDGPPRGFPRYLIVMAVLVAVGKLYQTLSGHPAPEPTPAAQVRQVPEPAAVPVKSGIEVIGLPAGSAAQKQIEASLRPVWQSRE